MEYEWFGDYKSLFNEQYSVKYYIRVFKENGKLRFQTLDAPPLPLEKYELRIEKYSVREHTLYSNNWGTRQILFYLDDVQVPHEITNEAASKIFKAMGWLSEE